MHDPVPVLGSFHDAPQRGNFFEHARHGAIGGDHEIFDQFRAMIFLLPHHVHNLLIHHDRPQFAALEIQRAMTDSAGS